FLDFRLFLAFRRDRKPSYRVVDPESVWGQTWEIQWVPVRAAKGNTVDWRGTERTLQAGTWRREHNARFRVPAGDRGAHRPRSVDRCTPEDLSCVRRPAGPRRQGVLALHHGARRNLRHHH